MNIWFLFFPLQNYLVLRTQKHIYHFLSTQQRPLPFAPEPRFPSGSEPTPWCIIRPGWKVRLLVLWRPSSFLSCLLWLEGGQWLQPSPRKTSAGILTLSVWNWVSEGVGILLSWQQHPYQSAPLLDQAYHSCFLAHETACFLPISRPASMHCFSALFSMNSPLFKLAKMYLCHLNQKLQMVHMIHVEKHLGSRDHMCSNVVRPHTCII